MLWMVFATAKDSFSTMVDSINTLEPIQYCGDNNFNQCKFPNDLKIFFGACFASHSD